MYVCAPRLGREAVRTFQFEKSNDPYDYSTDRCSVLFPFAKAQVAEEPKKQLTKAKAGDRLVLLPKNHFQVANRIISVEVAPALYYHGVPNFQRLYEHGDKAFSPLFWECSVDLDLKTLPYLYRVYIVDEHVR